MEKLEKEWEINHAKAVGILTNVFNRAKVTILVVKGAPENDQQWIDTCLQWKPVRIVGTANRSYLHFSNTEEALRFACEMEGKSFKRKPLEVVGIYAPEPAAFSELVETIKREARKLGKNSDYDITPSYGPNCSCCGHAISAHEVPLNESAIETPPLGEQDLE